jgi:hypothetical protein
MRPTAAHTTHPSSSAGRRRGVQPVREAMRSQQREQAAHGCPPTPACAADPRRRRTRHTAATRRDLAPVDRSSHRCRHGLGEDLARPRDHAARRAHGDGGGMDRRRGVSPCQRVYETDGTCARFAHRRPAPTDAARRRPTKTRRRDATAPTSKTLLVKNFRGCLTDRGSAAARRAPPYHRRAAARRPPHRPPGKHGSTPRTRAVSCSRLLGSTQPRNADLSVVDAPTAVARVQR